MSSGNAVFLSYASEDAPAVQRVADALRAAGIEVWFDREELRGGDAWDRRIREQIRDCRLLIPVISAQTEAREEGYFRREWKLAVDRTHDMAEKRAFLVPVVLDSTHERNASVPDKFRELQWTRLPGGETSAAFVERIRRLLGAGVSSGTVQASVGASSVPRGKSLGPPGRLKFTALAIAVLLAVTLVYFAIEKSWMSKQSSATSKATVPPAFAPPPHSIAVLPFVNVSGDREQEYFSEGLTEEILNSLSRVNELQVAARTSSFSFQGDHPDIATVSHRLNVGAVLEGSVRRAGNTVRVTTQLINGVTGFHLWSETYDRNLGDILKLQTEIATAVASALKVTLLGDQAARIEVGGTRNPAAFDAYLHGQQVILAAHSAKDIQDAITAFSQAVGLDPNYAAAFAVRSRAWVDYATDYAPTGTAVNDALGNAQSDANKAVALAPDLDEAHLSLALCSETTLNFALADQEYMRALALSPNNVRTLWRYSSFAAAMGKGDAAIAAARKTVVLDPLQGLSRWRLGLALYYAREYKEALIEFGAAVNLRQEDAGMAGVVGITHYTMGDLRQAAEVCESKPDNPTKQWCLAMTYEKLGRHGDAEAALAHARQVWNESGAFEYATAYGQWGNTKNALEWLDNAMRLRSPDLKNLKVNPLLDPLRKEPRFQAIEQALQFPN